MGFKDKLVNKSPYAYILAKSRSINMIKSYKSIKDQNLFDEEFYLSKYPKVKKSGMDPLIHYLFYGYLEGKKPFKDFDGGFYSYHYNVEINPLIHYALIGKDKGYDYKCENFDLNSLAAEAPIFVLHEKITNLGGASLTILDIIKSLDFAYILTSDGEDVELWQYNSRLEKLKNWEISYKTDYSLIDDNEMIISDDFNNSLFNNKLYEVYNEILTKLNIPFIHINHLINHSFDLFEIAIKNNIPYLLNIHDFYYLCPSIHLLNENLNYCNLNCTDSCAINIDRKSKLQEVLKIWRNLNEKYLKNSIINIVPSYSTITIYNKIFPNINNFKVIEPGRDLEILNHDSYFNNNKIKIFIPGHISPHKGSFLIREIKKLDTDKNLELHFAGTTIPNLNNYGINHGRYKREEFNQLVQSIKPTYIAILSNCFETYSHTLTEAIAAQIPVLTTNLGALKDRVEETGIGWTFDPNAEIIYENILNINEKEYHEKIKNLSKVKLPKYGEMIEKYNKIYSKIKR